MLHVDACVNLGLKIDLRAISTAEILISFITKINIGNICFRSISPEVFYKKGALRNFAKFTGEHLYQILFFNKVTGWGKKEKKKEALAQVFSCDFGKNSKKTFSYRTPPVAASDVSLYNIYEHKTWTGTCAFSSNNMEHQNIEVNSIPICGCLKCSVWSSGSFGFCQIFN